MGFSEFVYPGATHTRFAHSVGVFNNARRLIEIIKQKSPGFDSERSFAALCAALLHDLGHGPFSHAFEGVEKGRGRGKSHEDWSADIIQGDTQVGAVLRECSGEFPSIISKIVGQTEGGDIYSSVVSSQFDADRLDYLKRDRYMTGIGSGDFDIEWILDCLELGTVTVGQEDDYVDVPSFYLNHKGYKTAESYLQARFQLYSMVYMHKTTRAAEKMLAALLGRVAKILIEEGPDKLGIHSSNLLAAYFMSEDPSLDLYLSLDDSVVWSSLRQLEGCSDSMVVDLAKRILHRDLYKCIDIGSRPRFGTNVEPRFRKALRERAPELGLEIGLTLLEDGSQIGGYKWYDWDSENALKMVLVDDSEQSQNIQDIAATSRIVQALAEERLYRVYVPDAAAKAAVEALWNEVVS